MKLKKTKSASNVQVGPKEQIVVQESLLKSLEFWGKPT